MNHMISTLKMHHIAQLIGKLRDKAENGDNCTQALHVRIVKVLYGVLPKVQIILQFIGILVEMPVEISYCLLFPNEWEASCLPSLPLCRYRQI